VVEALRYKLENWKVANFIPGGVKVPGIFPGGKGSRCVGLTTLPPSCADCLKVWEPQPPGALGAFQGL
jgi:hypothetical protein